MGQNSHSQCSVPWWQVGRVFQLLQLWACVLQAPSETGYIAQGGYSAVSRAYEKENPTS